MGLFTKALGTSGHQPLAGLVRSKAKGSVIARSTGGNQTGTYGYFINDMDVDEAERLYSRVIMVFRCVDVIASTQAKIPIVLKRNGEDGEIIEDTDLDRLLNVRWNDDETALAARYRLSAQLLLSRRGAFVELIRNAFGTVVNLRLLPPGETEPIKCSQHFIDGYKVRGSDFKEYRLDKKDVIWIKIKPHPFDPYSQMTPLAAARLAADTDWLARMFNRNFLMNDGRPGMLIAIRGQMSVEDAQEVKSRFQGGYTRAGMSTVVEADGIDVQDLASSPRDIQWAEAVRGSDEDIRLAFGVPESQMGNASGRTFANADAESEIFYKTTITDHCTPIANALDELTDDLGDDIRPFYDWAKVEELQRNNNMRKAQASEDYEAGRITLDEWREIHGKPLLNLALSRVIVHKLGVVDGSPEDVDKVAELPNISMPKPVDPMMMPGMGQNAPGVAWQTDGGQDAIEGGTDYAAALTAVLGAIQTKAAMRPKVIRGEVES